MMQDLQRQIRISTRTLAVSLVAANLLSGWIPDEQPGKPDMHNDRVMRAIRLASDIVFDAETSAIAKEIA